MERDEYPLKGWPYDVIPLITGFIREDLYEYDNLHMFYIGRCGISQLDSRFSDHGAEEIIPIYQTTSVDNAIEVEDALINTFYEHDKCDNDAENGGGGVSEDVEHYVYLALWWK